MLLHPSLAGKVTSIEDLDDASYRIAATEGTTGEAAAQRFLGAARLSSFATPEEGRAPGGRQARPMPLSMTRPTT